MRVRSKRLVDAQFESGVFDTDYNMGKSMPKRESAAEWETRLRNEDLEKKNGRTKAALEDLEEDEPMQHQTRFGSLSGANVIEPETVQTKQASTAEVEVTQAEVDRLRSTGADVSKLKVGSKIKVAKLKWS
jgi:hypothetical protein